MISFFASYSGPTKPPGQWVLAVVKRPAREADHLHLVPRLRIRGAQRNLPHTFFMV
jgi:hypothetical protein